MAKLNAIKVKNAKPGRHHDGRGLYLLVKPSGSRSWVLRVQVDHNRREIGLGSAALVSLHEARDKAMEGLRMAKAGFNPVAEWKRVREVMPSFEDAARRYHSNVKAGWKNGKHANQWLATLEAHAFTVIGRMSVDRVEAADIQKVLLPIWLTTPETARRVRQRIGAVLDYAHSQGWRPSEAPMRAVAKGLPKQSRKGGHFPAMPYADVPVFVSGLRAQAPSAGMLALQFAILTAARSGEVRGATWDEVDMEAARWDIPGSRMKAGDAHCIPLSEAALEVLRRAAELFGSKPGRPLFPGPSGKPLSDMTMAKVLKVRGGSGYTVHGFRSAFRDWIAEQTKFPGDVAEAALAHTPPNRVEAAYRRTRFFDQRRPLMDAWGAFLAGSDNVVRLAATR